MSSGESGDDLPRPPADSAKANEPPVEGTKRRWTRRLLRLASNSSEAGDKSGLTSVTYPTMVNAAADAAFAVALANTVFFAGPSAGSAGGIAVYLALTMVPFALLAPVIGPALDRIGDGRRVALAVTFVARAVLCIVMIMNFDSATGSYPAWVLYPCALGTIVLSKTFTVLRSAIAPRVLPPSSSLAKLNSGVKISSLIGGTIVGGSVAAAIEYGYSAISTATTGLFGLIGLPGAMLLCVALTVAGAALSMRIPRWVEVTKAEVPATLSYHQPSGSALAKDAPKRRQRLGRIIIASFSANATIKIMAGFLFLYPAFVAHTQVEVGSRQLTVLGLVGLAATIGTFAGSAVAERIHLGEPGKLVIYCAVAVTAIAALTALGGSFYSLILAALVTAVASAIAKTSLDATLQDELPEESLASGFGLSESLLQVGWVAGGAVAALISTQLRTGFSLISVILAAGTALTVFLYRNGGKRPLIADRESA